MSSRPLRVLVMNAAKDSWYPRGQDRLAASLKNVGYEGEVKLWRNELPPACPPHSLRPYAFKPYAFRWAQGVSRPDIAIWFDASMWAVKSLDPIIEHIATNGVAVWLAGFSVGEWTHDNGLARLKLTRDHAMKIPLVCGGICGFDLRTPLASRLLGEWFDYANDGVSFPGAWRNELGCCSKDPRCLGHRHDMPSLSWLVHAFAIKPIECPKWFAYATDADPENPNAIMLARGM